MSRVIISLATYNGAEHLPLFLESVAKQTFSDYEFVVCDNVSVDSSVSLIESAIPDARIIRKDINCGFAKAHNEIIEMTQSEYILVVNQDIYLEDDYIEKCVAFLDGHPLVGSITGLCVRVPSLRELEGADRIDAAGISLKYRTFFVERLRNEPIDVIRDNDEVFGVPATAAFYRRSALEKCALAVQGKKEYFDADFFMYKEDIDLAFRLRWAGFLSYVVPSAKAYHIRSGKKEARRSNAFINYVSYRNNLELWYKNMSFGLCARLFPSLLFFETAKFAYCLLREPRNIRAWADVWRLRASLREKRRIIMASRTVSDRSLMTALTL